MTNTRIQQISAITPGMTRNQNNANGVTTKATMTVTSSARGSVLRGFPGETNATEPITTMPWISQRTSSTPMVMRTRYHTAREDS